MRYFFNIFSSASTPSERVAYMALVALTFSYTVVVIGCEFDLIKPKCDLPPRVPPLKYANIDYEADPCYHVRYGRLLGMTTWECTICTRVLASIVLGTVIGWERALHGTTSTGMRTMAILCLGACCFCIASVFAFIDGPMWWDASRSCAAIPTGVGFLGGATIWKGVPRSSGRRQEIHGLTAAILVRPWPARDPTHLR